MGEKEFIKLCRKCVADYYCWKKYTADDIYIIWLNKTIQNNKAMRILVSKSGPTLRPKKNITIIWLKEQEKRSAKRALHGG